MAVYKKQTLTALFLIVLVDVIGLGLIIPFVPIIFKLWSFFPPDFPENAVNIILGLLLASYSIFQFFGSPILGRLSDRFGRRPVLILSLLGSMAGYLLFPLGIYLSSVALLFLSRVIDGFTGGNISVAMAAIADVSKDEKERVRNFGLIGMAFGLGFIIGPALGGVLSDSRILPWFSIHVPFLAAAILTAINTGLAYRFKETIAEKSRRPITISLAFSGIGRAFTIRGLRSIYVALFVVNIGWVFFENFFQVFMHEGLGFTTTRIALLFAYIGVWIVIAQGYVVRKAALKFAPLKVLRKSLIAFSIVTVLVVFLPAGTLYITLALLALFVGFNQPNFSTLLTTRVDARSAGEVLGMRQAILSLSNIIPPLAGGFLLNIDVSAPLLTGSFCTLLGWIAVLLIREFTGEKIQLN